MKFPVHNRIRYLGCVRALLPILLLCHGVLAQILPTPTLPTPATAAATPLDRLGRTTPKTSFLGLLRAAHQGNFARAIRYIQFPPQMTESEKLEASRQLVFILDRGYVGNLDSISAKPEGSPDDGLAGDRESVGAIFGGDQSTQVQMVRVTENGQLVWLISRETVDLLPQLFPDFGFPAIESRLPKALLEIHLFSMPLWVLLAILAFLPMAYGLAWWICRLGLRLIPASLTAATRPSMPAVLFVALFLHHNFARLLGLPLLYRVWYSRVLVILGVAAGVWAIFGIIGHLDERARAYLARNQRASTQAVLQLSRRILQIFVVLGAVLVALRALGYDITAALAGLGIGGIAIAFAAQKTLENVFGGLTLLSDESIRAGDTCLFGTTTATVEDIGLRATRFRTLQRSVLYIPNGQLATMNIENMGQRDKILFRHTIGVKYGLEPEELKGLLRDLRLLFANDERIDDESARVRFLKFGAYSLDLELFAFVKTNDWPLFLEIQEELLLRVMEIVRKHDSDFALPSQTLYVEKGELPGTSEAITKAIGEEEARLKDGNRADG